MTLKKYWVLKEWLGYTIQFSSFSGRQVETVPVYEADDVDRVVGDLANQLKTVGYDLAKEQSANSLLQADLARVMVELERVKAANKARWEE